MTSKAKPNQDEKAAPKKTVKDFVEKVAAKVTHKKVEAPDVITNGADEPVVTVTDAEAAVKDRDGHAVMTVEVPARTVEVSIAHSDLEGCAVAAVEAWDRIKGAGDADFAAMADVYRRELMQIAEDVFRGTPVQKGDTAQARFAQEVAKIKGEQSGRLLNESRLKAKDSVAGQPISSRQSVVNPLPASPSVGSLTAEASSAQFDPPASAEANADRVAASKRQ